MLAIVGTVPDPDLPVISGTIGLEHDKILIRGSKVPVNRGTPALMAAAVKTCEALGQSNPYGYLAGDIGRGKGSRLLYEYLTQCLVKDALQAEPGNFNVIAFHYLQPDVDWHNRVLMTVDDMPLRPVLIADAGFMYAAKMSGQASQYDLFTPDVGELAFLADEEAPHPFYTRGFILHEDSRAPELISRAYRHNNASRCLLVKGKHDYVASKDGILHTVSEPSVGNMEPIGGTGDTLTGIAAALIASGRPVPDAALLAAKANRVMGELSEPTPASSIPELLPFLQKALEEVIGYNMTNGSAEHSNLII